MSTGYIDLACDECPGLDRHVHFGYGTPHHQILFERSEKHPCGHGFKKNEHCSQCDAPSFGEQAIEILSNTHDGDDLTPYELKLVERIVNGNVFAVSETDEVAFVELHKRVTNG
jgi:hypothetical protein